MRFRLLIVLFMAWCLAWCGTALAGEFESVAREVKKDLAEAGREAELTREKLAAEMAALEKQLVGLQAELKQEQESLGAEQSRLTRLNQEHENLERRLEGSQAQIDEVAGLVRGAARSMLALAEHSPISAENPDRLAALRTYIDNDQFPSLDDLRELVEHYLTEITASGQIIQRQGSLVDKAGKERAAKLVRLGAFNTLYLLDNEAGYARLGPGTGRLLAVGGDLPWWVRSNLENYFSSPSPGVYLDISGGEALNRLTQRSSWWDNILAGGPLVWPILAVGLAALLLILERVVFLSKVHANTDKLMDTVNRQVAEGDFKGAWQTAESQSGRPTSNVIKAGLSLQGCQPEVIKSGLSEGMLKEMPRLERFLSVLKVLAAIAPLLGLLGTVSGMINTFHVITVHGTGDPRLMAGGISEALVTTELGLAVAIPILVCSSLLGRRAQHVVTDMEEKAVALTAALIKAGGPA